MCSWCGKAISATNWPCPLSSGASSNRGTERPRTWAELLIVLPRGSQQVHGQDPHHKGRPALESTSGGAPEPWFGGLRRRRSAGSHRGDEALEVSRYLNVDPEQVVHHAEHASVVPYNTYGRADGKR